MNQMNQIWHYPESVDTCSISTGEGWIWVGRNSLGLRFVVGSKILSKVQELGCV